jgi:hypothetical protein
LRALVDHPRLEQVLNEDVALEQDVVIGLERVQRLVERARESAGRTTAQSAGWATR